MSDPTNVVNPGLVNVADQADGPILVNQTVTTGPSTNAGPTSRGLTYADGVVLVEQPVGVSPSTNAGPTTQGGSASPTSSNVINTTANNVADQVFGTGTPANVFV